MSTAILAPTFAQEIEPELKLELSESQITLEAKNVELVQILQLIGSRAGFGVKLTRSGDPSPLVTGRKTGNPPDVLGWLLRSQNYVLLHDQTTDDKVQGTEDLARIFLMGTKVRAEGLEGGSTGSDLADGPRAMDAGLSSTGVRTEAQASNSINPHLRDFALARGVILDGTGSDSDAATESMPPVRGSSVNLVETLNPAGAALSGIIVDPHKVDIARTIEIGDDTLLATHAMAHKAAGGALQRTESGDWIPWDGHTESLIDNQFMPVDGNLTFDLIEGDLSEEFYPIEFTIAYRTEAGLNFGVFEVMPDQRIPE